MTVSIIIAAKTWQDNLEECVGKCQQLDYPDYEIIILPDEPFDSAISYELSAISENKGAVAIKIIPTGLVNPSQKRDMALNYAKGEILAFIDDDAYPAKDWLKNGLENFKNPDIAAVGGPAITPVDDNLRQKASGMVYASFLVSAKFSYRYLPRKKREVDDYPTCNFLVRKSIMQELGGFKTNFWPGEDTKLCLDITKRSGNKIIYDPEVLVYHHRRPLFLPHLRQVANYALHRGYFVKRYPATSLKAAYFVPTIFLLIIFLGGILSIFLLPFKIAYLLALELYLLLIFAFSISYGLVLGPWILAGIILTHITYGFYFLKGLLSKRLKEEK